MTKNNKNVKNSAPKNEVVKTNEAPKTKTEKRNDKRRADEAKLLSEAKTNEAPKQSEIVIQAPTTQAPHAPNVQRLSRFTIFGRSLTSVVKAMTLHDDLLLSSKECMIVAQKLAECADKSKTFAPASVTTAHSDAKNVKYCKTVAPLAPNEIKLVKSIIDDAQKQAAKQAPSVVVVK